MFVRNTSNGADAPVAEETRDQNAAQPSEAQDDIDAADLAAALAAAEAEERAAQEAHEAPVGGTATAPESGEGAEATEAPATDDQSQERAPGAVPYQRFRQVNESLNTTKAENEYLKGKVEAMEALVKGGGALPTPATQAPSQAAPTPVPPDQIKQIREAIEAEAEKYDRGEITLKEYEKFRGEREDQIRALELQRVTDAVARQAAAPSMADEAMLAAHAQALDQQYPYLQVMSHEQLLRLRDMAIVEAQQAGRPFGSTAQDTRRLREAVAQLSVGFGPAWGLTLPQTPSAPNTQSPSGSNAGRPALSPAAQARQRKHDMAADMPPDTTHMGSAGNQDTFSEQRIAAMTDEEILALPATVRQRFLTG